MTEESLQHTERSFVGTQDDGGKLGMTGGMSF